MKEKVFNNSNSGKMGNNYNAPQQPKVNNPQPQVTTTVPPVMDNVVKTPGKICGIEKNATNMTIAGVVTAALVGGAVYAWKKRDKIGGWFADKWNKVTGKKNDDVEEIIAEEVK